MIFLLWCLIILCILSLIAVREGYVDFTGNTHINLPTYTGQKVNYNFSGFGSNGIVEGKVNLRPSIPPPRANHYRNWVWDVYYVDKDGHLHSSGHWNYYDTYDYDYDYYGPNGISNYNRYFY